MSDSANRWSHRYSKESEDSDESKSDGETGSRLKGHGGSETDEARPQQASPKPTVDPLPAVPDDELDGVRYLIERVGLLYFKSCRTVASAINRLKQMAD